ncbi:MAG TPA: hypothetical protein VKE73_07495, partial [Myxococcota bacterium]|nr:hypothetical protein [Myxococcota bacterium]
PLAKDGLVGCNGRVWTRSGHLLASGTSHLFCRPNPQYAEELRLRREREGSAAPRTQPAFQRKASDDLVRRDAV